MAYTTDISKLVQKSHYKPGIDLSLFACAYEFAIMLQKNCHNWTTTTSNKKGEPLVLKKLIG